jgi:hypothetical protein
VVSVVKRGKEKRVVVDSATQVTVEAKVIPCATALSVWKYLGIEFGYTGKRAASCQLAGKLRRITCAPLKPMQRMTVLRNYLIPSISFQLTQARVC